MKLLVRSIVRFFLDLWSRIKKYFWLKKHRLKELKTVDVRKATKKDLEKLGRPVSTLKVGDGKIEPIKLYMQCIRNKKNGRVVMFPGNIEQIKSIFGDDYEIVESAIKEDVGFEVDINKDGFFGRKE